MSPSSRRHPPPGLRTFAQHRPHGRPLVQALHSSSQGTLARGIGQLVAVPPSRERQQYVNCHAYGAFLSLSKAISHATPSPPRRCLGATVGPAPRPPSKHAFRRSSRHPGRTRRLAAAFEPGAPPSSPGRGSRAASKVMKVPRQGRHIQIALEKSLARWGAAVAPCSQDASRMATSTANDEHSSLPGEQRLFAPDQL